ncbi:MAG: elongation factor G [Muribaculaceae bacterium]|nr:elongation factor G [Muribaculaceae bacterium]
MKVYKTDEIRNISLLGGKGSGKTTLAESILFECGVLNRRGTIAAGNTVCDYFPVEKEYGYSVFSTLFYAEKNDKKINFIDCPGSDDFVGNVVTALNVTDAALMLIDGQYGIEVGTQNQYRTLNNIKKPVIFAVNKLEAEKTDFDNVLNQLKESFGNKVVPVQFPAACGPGFKTIIDLLLMKQLTYGPDGGKATVADIDPAYADKAEELKAALVEMAAENDEALMDKFFEEGELSEAEMIEGIRKGLIDRSIIPVMCVAGEKNMGVDRLLDVLGAIVPSPKEMPTVADNEGNEVPVDENAPLSLFFFKTTIEPHIGEVSYFKVMSGTIKSGTDLNNMNRGSKERIAQINAVYGLGKTPVDQMAAGDIGATVKMKDVRRGNTLNEKDCEHIFDFIEYPAPKYQRAVKPVNESEIEKLGTILNRMHEEDPTWLVEQSKELKQTIVSGQGEFHLRTLKWRIENNDKVQIEFLEPKIPYRETITKAARADYRHKKQSGGSGQFGEVHLIVEPYREGMPEPDVYKFGNQEFKMNIKDKQEIPMEWGGMLVIYNCIVGGAIDARFIPAIVKGIMDRMEQGPLTGSYARDVRVCIYDGKMHPVDSNEISFRLAARHAFSDAFRNANPKVLEPVYDVEVLMPAECMGDVMSDLQGRRAIIMGMNEANGLQKIDAKVPLKEMASYSTALSSVTGGRASFNMKFASYELVPTDVQAALLKAYEESKQEED